MNAKMKQGQKQKKRNNKTESKVSNVRKAKKSEQRK
jgi:hypothetical protein